MKRIRQYIPLPALILYGLALAAAGIHIAVLNSVPFADGFNRWVSPLFRGALAYATNWLPCSLAEFLLLTSPLTVTVLIVFAVRAANRSSKSALRFLTGLLSVLSLLYTLFVGGFAPAYQGSTLESKLGLTRRKLSADDLYRTAEILRDKTEEELAGIDFIYGGFSVMPYSRTEMSEKLNDAYAAARERYPFLQSIRTKVKFILLSEPMTYTHISGVYTYFTGEANVNTHFPDYTLPFTAAHELAHQRGIAREDEANFMAFLICSSSDDPYIRYSAYLNMMEYVMNALYSADADRYYQFLDSIHMSVRSEMIAYSRFFDKYRKTVVSEVSEAVNNTYLQAQGQTEGTKSYGRVVDLAAVYYLDGGNAHEEP